MDTMPPTQAQELRVALFDLRDAETEDYPEAKAWVLNSKARDNASIRLWTSPSVFEELRVDHPDLPEAAKATPSGGFVRGRALLQNSFTIKTCGLGGIKIPHRLFRVIRDGVPFEGIKARGHGLVETNSIFFQNLLQKHMNWNCRHPSPFMSATDAFHLVATIASFHQVRGRTGIQVLTIDMTKPQWDHRKQRVWNLGQLVDQFKLRKPYPCGREFLIEDSIPPGCVVKRENWSEACERYDPHGLERRKQKEKNQRLRA